MSSQWAVHGWKQRFITVFTAHSPLSVAMETLSGFVTYTSVFPSSMLQFKSPSKLSKFRGKKQKEVICSNKVPFFKLPRSHSTCNLPIFRSPDLTLTSVLPWQLLRVMVPVLLWKQLFWPYTDVEEILPESVWQWMLSPCSLSVVMF